MSPTDALATAKSIWRHLAKVNGYQPYGYDWRTLRITQPQLADVLADCYRVMGHAKAEGVPS